MKSTSTLEETNQTYSILGKKLRIICSMYQNGLQYAIGIIQKRMPFEKKSEKYLDA